VIFDSSLFTLHTSHFTLHSSLFTLYSSPFTLHPLLFTLHSLLFTLHSSLFTLFSSLFTLHSSPCLVKKSPDFGDYTNYTKRATNIDIQTKYIIIESNNYKNIITIYNQILHNDISGGSEEMKFGQT